jgi:multicomponent Na+:H+ antiporter subunit B
MKNEILITVSRFIFPFILALGFYVQINGNNAPGGGFQAGVIMASAFILFSLISGSKKSVQVLSLKKMKILASLGVILYAGTGFISVMMGGEFLNYSLLENRLFEKQTLGISLIEWGVGMTVFSVFSIGYYLLDSRGDK